MSTYLETQHINVDKGGLRVAREDILKLLGNVPDAEDEHAGFLVDKYTGECLLNSSPEGAFVLLDARDPVSSDEIGAGGCLFHTGSIIKGMLRHSETYAFFLATAGPAPEQMARALLNEGHYLEGYIADLVASSLVDLVADQVQAHIRKLAEKRGEKITNRYSPGYCSWKVEEQQKLFSLFPEACCGISLSPSSMMNPMKSISGIIGVGAQVAYRQYSCEICSMPDCMFRRGRD